MYPVLEQEDVKLPPIIHQFQIDEFKERLRNCPVGVYLEARPFEHMGLVWRMRVWLSGWDEAHQGFLGVYLRCGATPEYVRPLDKAVCALVSIVDEESGERVQWEHLFDRRPDDRSDAEMRVKSFIKTSYLLQTNGFLKDDKLRIDVHAEHMTEVVYRGLRNRKNFKDLVSRKFSDFRIVAEDGKVFPVNLSQLALVSPYFESHFPLLRSIVTGKPESEMRMAEPSAQVIREFLRYCYTSKLERLGPYPLDMLRLACRFQVRDLVDLCVARIVASMNDDQVGELLLLCDEFDCTQLRQEVLKYFLAHGDELHENAKFLEAAPNFSAPVHESLAAYFRTYFGIEWSLEEDVEAEGGGRRVKIVKTPLVDASPRAAVAVRQTNGFVASRSKI
ncbi:unnamed protein product [Trichogramma brassicae]|uniref:BTB domain-containing protein n=1 Tax=Trichogramma brassicae TaxID=86971 RepID=A0A6H5I581_9HYME|nr:unnamed protein product [Trichogramma brassicae]